MKKSGCLIKQNEIQYSNTPKKTLDKVIKKNTIENQKLETDRFHIHVKRAGGIVTGIEIIHVDGDSIDLDFSYLE